MNIIGIISSASILIPFISGLFHLKYLDTPKKIFFGLICAEVLIEILLNHLANQGLNNLFICNVQILIEFLLIMLVFYHWLNPQKLKTLILASIIVYVIVWVYFTYKQGIRPFNMIGSAVECLLLSAVAAIYLTQLMKDISQSPFKIGGFWIAAGVFMYFTSSTFILGMFNYWVYSLNKHLVISYMIAHTAINITGNLLYAKGLWCKE
jgi:hypothetical protein